MAAQTSKIEYTSEPPKHLPRNYGSYHQLYRLDGELVAMAVLDILPSCVSSVYFVYDDKYERFSLGKVCSASLFATGYCSIRIPSVAQCTS